MIPPGRNLINRLLADTGIDQTTRNIVSDRLAKNFDAMDKIERSVKVAREKLRREKLRHDDAVAVIEKEIEIIRAECLHAVTHYSPDSAGGSDSTTTCEICGYQWSH